MHDDGAIFIRLDLVFIEVTTSRRCSLHCQGYDVKWRAIILKVYRKQEKLRLLSNKFITVGLTTQIQIPRFVLFSHS